MPVTTYSNYVCDRCGAKADNQEITPAGWMRLSSMSDSLTAQASGVFCNGCAVGIVDATKALPPPEVEPETAPPATP